MSYRESAKVLSNDQRVVYLANDRELASVTQEFLEQISVWDAISIRYGHPFMVLNSILRFRCDDLSVCLSSPITDVEREGNTLTLKDEDSITYEIRYINIDLERMIREGEDKGINRRPGNYALPFPRPD
jgi:hypothetical protein